jgi:hypothetical protein
MLGIRRLRPQRPPPMPLLRRRRPLLEPPTLLLLRRRRGLDPPTMAPACPRLPLRRFLMRRLKMRRRGWKGRGFRNKKVAIMLVTPRDLLDKGILKICRPTKAKI